jgi:hypothetical protein
MIPSFNRLGNLPAGVHWSSWESFRERYGTNSHRKELLNGLKAALISLKGAGCKVVYIDGNFVSSKEIPADFDCCWNIEGVNRELLDPVFVDFSDLRAKQKARYGGELFPNIPGEDKNLYFLELFQIDKHSQERKGIIAIDLRQLK